MSVELLSAARLARLDHCSTGREVEKSDERGNKNNLFLEEQFSDLGLPVAD